MFSCNRKFSKMFIKPLLLVILIFYLADADDVLVTTPQGIVKGRTEYSRRNIIFYVFEQIPYAQPPIGNLRFKAPQPAGKWTGILDASTANNKICYQLSNVDETIFNVTEDCLYLNVYSPEFPKNNLSLPVMVYIYGGGFVDGQSTFNKFGPHYFMEGGVVLVAMNYRVGPFGFLTTGDTIIPGNYGLKDQNLALKWVQDNIGYFGGDPNKVTIFGQSAGGASVTYQLMSQKSKGLFRAAIAQSGSVLSPWAYQRYYKDYAYGLATYLNQDFNKNASSQELLDYLKSVSADDLKEAHQSFKESIGNKQLLQGFWFTPVVEPDHEEAFLTENMYEAIEKGHMNRVPLMIGINSEELIWWSLDQKINETVKQYDDDPSLLVNRNMHITDQEQNLNVGKKIIKIYTNESLEDGLAAVIRYSSDSGFTRGIIQHAKLQSQFSDIYFYQFSYHGQIGGDTAYVEGAERVGHSEDYGYLWVYNNNSNLNDYPEQDVLTSNRFRELFTNFAKTLNPTPTKANLGIEWPKVEPNNFQFININESLSIEKDPKGETHLKWVQLYEEYATKPYDTF